MFSLWLDCDFSFLISLILCDTQLRNGLALDPTYDERVFAPIRRRMGVDQLRLLVSGAAPLAPFLWEFLRVVMCSKTLQGYGLTGVCFFFVCLL